MTWLDIHWLQKSLKLIKTKALMIKINVITNNKSWLNYIKKPNYYLDKKIKKINLEEKKLKKKIYFAPYYSREIKKLNTLIINLGKKIR